MPWTSIQHRLSDATAFLYGHHGYAYVDPRGMADTAIRGLVDLAFFGSSSSPPGS